ncbi:MAG: phage baseplate protein [Desulfuromonadaceae bacterium]
MASFSALDMVHLWEVGRRQHPLEQALTILEVACPEIARSTLSALTIGQRDTLIFQLREQTLGERLDALVECPQCHERLEFSMPSVDLRNRPEARQSDPVYECDDFETGMKMTFRLPDSRDLAVASGNGTPEAARAMLVERCVIEASLDGTRVSAHELPDTAITMLAERMAECDPVADILLNLDCPACHAEWQQPFDIVSFFWSEITVQAKRLLREVHTLAHAYGWREVDILSMSTTRRNYYLEMISG